MRTDGIHVFVFCARPHTQYACGRTGSAELYAVALPGGFAVFAKREL